MTDQPWTFVEVSDASGTKSIKHYHGCGKAPESLSTLEDSIIDLAGAKTWIGSKAARSRQKWTRNSP
jgi:hypothetical protein